MRLRARAGCRDCVSACTSCWWKVGRSCRRKTCPISSTEPAISVATWWVSDSRYSTRASVRRQVAAEIEAQFEAYRATGLALDHVDAHKHFHLHPTVGSQAIAIGRRYGLRALRVPREPGSVLARVEPSARRWPGHVAAPWVALLGRRARGAGLKLADAVFGLAWSGAMTQSRLTGLLRHLPEGRTEIYMHPATGDNFDGHAPGYRYADELAALTAPAAIAAARRPDVTLGGYADF